MIDIGVAPFSTGDPHQRWLSFGPALTGLHEMAVATERSFTKGAEQLNMAQLDLPRESGELLMH
jgi:hypothetical protein